LWAHQHTARKAIDRAGVADADKEDAEQEKVSENHVGRRQNARVALREQRVGDGGEEDQGRGDFPKEG
jgi:hypothetical protein